MARLPIPTKPSRLRRIEHLELLTGCDKTHFNNRFAGETAGATTTNQPLADIGEAGIQPAETFCRSLLMSTGGCWKTGPVWRMMSDISWQLEYSVEVAVSPAFAWQYRTDVANWNDPPAQFALDGPFQAGSQGTTQLPGMDTLHWHIREVRHGESFVTEMNLDRATLTFEWYFDRVSDDRTRLTQRIILSGENAAAYREQVKAGFEPNLADGMNRIAVDMTAAEKRGMGKTPSADALRMQ